MKNATIVKMQVLGLAAAIVSATPAMLGQRSTPPASQAQTAPNATPMQNAAQMQAAPAAAQNSVCGNQALCYETTDFAATITQFRVSTDAWQNKVLDVMMHFQNKTNQLLSLGYVDGSASGLDDRGNRFGMNTANGGVRGIGVVAGNNMDPKFTLQPGGAGDARFELYWSPRGQIAGVQYEVELSIREINRVEGNQWMLGNESLLHYDNLSNGVGVASASGSVGMGSAFSGGAGTVPGGVVNAPGGVVNSPVGMGTVSSGMATVNSVSSAMGGQPATAAAGQPCPPGTAATSKITSAANTAGQQNATANTVVSNATTAISSLGSLFGHKKAAAPAATTTASATPCVATTNAAAVRPVSTANPLANTAPQQPAGTAIPATASAAASKATATQRTTAVTRSATTQQTTTGVTKASLKQPVAAANTAKTPAATTTQAPAAPAKKKPAVVLAPAPSGGGSH